MLATAFGHDERFHLGLVVLVLPSSALGLILGCRRHRDAGVPALGALGLMALVIVGLWGHGLFGEAWERAATAGASASVALAHLRSYRLCRRDPCER
jgi:hypothetical protein